MFRFSLLSLFANLAAVCLIGLTGVALAGPLLPSEITGVIEGSATTIFSNAFIETLSPLFLSVSNASSSVLSTDLLYSVFATISAVISSVSGSSIIVVISGGGSSSILAPTFSFIGYVLNSDLLNALLPSLVSSAPGLPIIDASETLFFIVDPGQIPTGLSVPEPSGVAVVVTFVAGVAAIVGRRKLKRA